MFYGIVLGIHVIVCVVLVLIVLMQAAKGGGLAGGSAFGGGAESTVFGGRGAATFLSKATTVFAAVFMLTSLSLTIIGIRREDGQARSVVAEEAARTPLGVPATAPPSTGAPGLPGDGAIPGAVPAPTGSDASPADAGSTEPASGE